jgi:regulatory protein
MEDEKNLEEHKCYVYCLRLLAGQDYSWFKIRQKLTQKKYPKEIIDSALQKLLEENLVNEQEYQNILIRKYMRKGFAPSFIQQKLKQEELFVSLEDIQQCFYDNDWSEEKQIEYLVEKKTRGLNQNDDAFKNKMKIANFLKSKGHYCSFNEY